MIDLHSHTNESDGTTPPAELVQEALAAGLEALGVTDHDTLAGYDQAAPVAAEAGLDIVCGVELSTKLHGKSVHLLGYFVNQPPSDEFRGWLHAMQESRRDRNRRMIERLRSLGLDITLEEVQAVGRSLAGRPHFARILVQKGYVQNTQQAFDEYLDASAKGYVDRMEPAFAEAVERIVDGGGIPSVAHPVRLGRNHAEKTIGEMVEMGLKAVEVYHSDHSPADTAAFLAIADRYGLAVTGGSDFHGDAKPRIRLGTGHDGNLNVPLAVLQNLRAAA